MGGLAGIWEDEAVRGLDGWCIGPLLQEKRPWAMFSLTQGSNPALLGLRQPAILFHPKWRLCG